MNLSSLLFGVAVSSFCIAGCADPESIDSEAKATESDEPLAQEAAAGVDLTGTWFAKVKTKADITVPIVGLAPSDIDLALKLLVRKVDDRLEADIAICNLATNSPMLVLGFDRVEPFIKLTESIPDFTAAVGGKVPLPAVSFNIGQDAAGAAVDIEADGQKGATVGAIALGLVPLDAYVGLKLDIGMDATLQDPETVVGTATFGGNGVIFGSNFPLLTSGDILVTQTLTPTPFQAKHYAGDVSCAELLAKP